VTSGQKIRFFEEKHIRAVWDEQAEKWWFPIIDIIALQTQSSRSPVLSGVCERRQL
jgi:hypothetical protein